MTTTRMACRSARVQPQTRPCVPYRDRSTRFPATTILDFVGAGNWGVAGLLDGHIGDETVSLGRYRFDVARFPTSVGERFA